MLSSVDCITTTSVSEFLVPTTPRFIALFSAWAPSHHSLASVAFITNIAESNFRYTHLDIPRRPVVSSAEAGNALGRFRDRDRLAERLAEPDPDAKLELVVEVAARTKARLCFRRGLALAVRPSQRRAGREDRWRPGWLAGWGGRIRNYECRVSKP